MRELKVTVQAIVPMHLHSVIDGVTLEVTQRLAYVIHRYLHIGASPSRLAHNERMPHCLQCLLCGFRAFSTRRRG
ncbi:hypothetical protein D3C80_144140 [compost metagenome]